MVFFSYFTTLVSKRKWTATVVSWVKIQPDLILDFIDIDINTPDFIHAVSITTAMCSNKEGMFGS